MRQRQESVKEIRPLSYIIGNLLVKRDRSKKKKKKHLVGTGCPCNRQDICSGSVAHKFHRYDMPSDNELYKTQDHHRITAFAIYDILRILLCMLQ